MNAPLPSPPENATSRFADRAADYAKARPSYPDALVDAVLGGLGDPSSLTIADVGAGTGVFSRLLADRGVRVVAIEPNAAMRHAAAAHPNIEWRDGTGESTGLPNHSVDLITVAQAFHWMRPEDALREFHRILKPGGRLAHVWNIQDRSDPFTSGYCAAMERHAVDPPRSPWSLHDVSAVLDNHPLFTGREVVRVPSAQSLDFGALVARARSASYCPKSGPGWDALRAELASLFDRFASEGAVNLRYSSEAHISRAHSPM
jgi:SAM-dependent methyltransferase